MRENSPSLESGKPHSSKPRKLENEAEVSLSAALLCRGEGGGILKVRIVKTKRTHMGTHVKQSGGGYWEVRHDATFGLLIHNGITFATLSS